MRILGLDIGEKRIGVAVSDPMGWTAQGLFTLTRGKLPEDLLEIQAICQKYEAEKVVVGYPINMNGTIGPKALEVKEFARMLEERLQLPIELWDERLTSRAAERVLLEADISRRKRKKVLDKLAAVGILQSYLDCKT